MTRKLKDLPDLLKRERKSRGLSQEDAAKIIARPRGTYGSYEEGRAEPSIDALICLATAYGYTSLDVFLFGEFKSKKGSQDRLVQLYMSANKRKREIVDYILGLKK